MHDGVEVIALLAATTLLASRARRSCYRSADVTGGSRGAQTDRRGGLNSVSVGSVRNAVANGDKRYRLPHTSSIAFESVAGEGIGLLLHRQGIAASSGSACTSGSLDPSRVVRAMAIPGTAAHATIRLPLSRYSTAREVEQVIAAVPPAIAKLRELSPCWSGDAPLAGPEEAFQPPYA
ncbi:MAG: Cysteine desulfurase [Candidatus Accumulibacter adjunctus]|uniref:Cysteine desulfurase n=1 Tax=Candidatus Accumulibacter adjunctus TaxID=1454001 RepID=A0A011NMD5_9PROT|nr:MAG: Cysteine desulfurase [Candidatus Accumulibacter adjunctus]